MCQARPSVKHASHTQTSVELGLKPPPPRPGLGVGGGGLAEPAVREACSTVTFWAAATMNFLDGLATEIWGKIFAQLLPQTRDVDLDQAATAAMVRDQTRFHNLKLVCSRFNAILQDPSFVISSVALDLRKFNDSSLKTWLQTQGGHQETLLLTSASKGAKSFLETFAESGSP